MEHLTVDLGDLRLHGVAAGQGPLLLLLHGFPEFWYSWRNQLPVLSRYFRTVALDLPGYDESEAPPSYAGPVLADLVARAIPALGHDRAILVGHDWGGVVAWQVAALHPSRVERLAILDAPHPAAMTKRLLRDWRQRLRSWYILAFQVPWLPERAILSNPRLFMRLAMRGTARVRSRISDADLDRYAGALAKPGRLSAALGYYRAAARGMLRRGRPRLPRVQCPTLVLWGACDHALGTELVADSLAYVDGPASGEILPDTGHWIQQERPDEVNDRLLRFAQ